MDGKMNKDDIFIADNILAKHDENYMPPELAQ
jgi:cytochrome c-type biogenesis protein CcmE